MMIKGYSTLEKIRETEKTSIYRGVRDLDRKSVIIKTSRGYSSLKDIEDLRHQYEITKSLDIEGVVRSLDIVEYASGVALILEDFGGMSLKDILAGRRLTIKEALEIGYILADILGELHHRNIIHKDIKPSNIIMNPDTGKVKLSDFSIARNIVHEEHKAAPSTIVEGTLAYMSPEQTGRMNRAVDYRADFYSLGVTLYEMLSGRLPFRTADAMELVHCQIARVPAPPHEINAEIPKTVSEIVMKLLSKNAENRYQSSYGIKSDLAACIRFLESEGGIGEFVIAQDDVSGRLNIPRKFYGRDAEIRVLTEALQRVSSGPSEIMLVRGYAGIGKTALVRQIHKPSVGQGGFFIEGKFEQYKRDIPYSAIILALKDLIGQLMTMSEERLAIWKERMLEALGPNGQIVINVIPEMELIIGKQMQPASLGPAETKNLFNMVFQDFIKVFARKEHPLVIFLDDLQYADTASLQLIETIITDIESSHLLLVMAYRDNEVNEHHPFMLTIDDIRKTHVPLYTIEIPPLERQYVNSLIADMLGCVKDKSRPLSNIMIEKTGGNPFFVNVFIRKLYEDRILGLDTASGTWQWDQEQINCLGVADNVIDLLVGKIRKLPKETQNILRLASCIGNTFDLRMLSIINESTLEHTVQALKSAIQEGLLAPLGSVDKLRSAYRPEETFSYRFQHDRVQEASYSLIEEEDSKAIYLKIGRVLLRNTPRENMEEVFEIVDHLNKGLELITDEDERLELAHLNGLAGKKAKSSSAYQQAVTFLSAGIRCLPRDAWESRYDLTFTLHREKSECEYLAGNHESAETLFDLILQKAKTSLDKAEIYNSRIILYASTGKFVDNNRLGSEALRLFHINFPDLTDRQALAEAFKEETAEYRQKMQSIRVENLINAPATTDPEARISLKLLINMFSSAYVSNPDFLIVAGLKAINLSLQHGICADAAYAFCVWGALLQMRFKDNRTSMAYGLLALKFNDKYNDPATRSNIPYVFGMFINHWRRHIKESIAYLKEGYKAGIETGDFVYASFSGTSLPRYLLSYGHDHLQEILEEIEKTFSFFKKIRNYASLERQQIVKYTVLNLMGMTKDFSSLSDDTFDETTHIEKMNAIGYGTGIALYYFYKLQTHYTYENYSEALKMAKQALANLAFIVSSMQEVDYRLYYGLSLAAHYPEAGPEEKETLLQELEECKSRMKRWHDDCPENFACRYLLLEAEHARITKKNDAAMDLFDQAIKTSEEQGFLSIYALANELSAKFYLSKGRAKVASVYMKDAHYAYSKWGAKGKVRQLEEKYQSILDLSREPFAQNAKGNVQRIPVESTDSSTRYVSIDLISVIKASRVISGEIILDKLIKNLMKIVIENAGADRALLLIEKAGRFFVGAQSHIDEQVKTALIYEPVEFFVDIPHSVINYVIRTNEALVLEDALTEGRFTTDPYIKKQQARSVLSVPIIEQSRTLGILYLENSQAKGTFTPERLATLKLLSSQAAISLKNALNYDELNRTKEELRESEEKYRILFENLQDVYYRTDDDQRVLQASPSVEKVFGYKPHEVIGMNVADIYVHPQQQSEFLSLIREKGYVEDYEVKLKCKDGSSIWVATNSHYYYGPDGNILGVEGMLRNIAERKRAEEMLVAEKERLIVTLRSIGDAVIATDTSGRISIMNKAAEQITGWKQVEAIGMPLMEVFRIIHKKTGAPYPDPVKQVLETGGMLEIMDKPVLISRNGEERVIADSVAPIRDQESKIIGVILVFRDISERQKLENELLKTQKLESLGIFAGGIAHDFNNILTGIIGNVSLAKLYAVPSDKILARLSEVEKAGLRAKDLTQQLLTFSKGGKPIKKATGVAEILKESTNFVLSGSKVKCDFRIPDDLWAIEADEGQMSQVINNLIINSLQAMPDGGTIRITAENFIIERENVLPLRPGRYLKISIKDRGHGIPQENLDKIFDPFFTTKPKGNGLGLSTTFTIIQKHDGYISVDSEIDNGATFTIYLPALSENAFNRNAAEDEKDFMGRGRVLLMDDEELVLDVGGELLKHLGFEVEYARDGQEAIEKYLSALESKNPFDLVIMDLTVPGGIGGKEAVLHLKRLNPSLRAIVSSGYSNDPVMADFRQYGFSGVILKPYRVAEIKEVIKQVMGTPLTY